MTDGLRICLLAGAFPVLSETFITNQVRSLRALGHTVVPVALEAPSKDFFQPEDEALSAEAERTPYVGRVAAMAASFRNPERLARAWAFCSGQTGIRPRSLFLSAAKTALIVRRHRCSHIHAHYAQVPAAVAIAAAKLAGTTCSFEGHGHDVYGSTCAPDLKMKLSSADFVVATCADMAAMFHVVAGQGLRVHVIPCGIDPSRFKPLAKTAERNGKLLAIGRLVPQKGYEVLIEALATMPAEIRPRIDAVGRGPLLDELQALAAARGVTANITFAGALPGTAIAEEGPAYLGYVAPFVTAPDGQTDTSPVAAKEAMSMGLPVVATAHLGLKEIVGPGTGRLVPPGDVAALAEGMKWLVGLPMEERIEIGARGRLHMQAHFTARGEALALANAISELAA